MTQPHYVFRPAMTAIAAVIALSSTASFAQSAETPTPIVETSSAPAPQSPDPLAPDVSTSTSTPEPIASETTVAPATTARPAARVGRPATRTTSVTRARTAAPVAADVATPATPAPIDPLLVPPEMAAPAPIAVPAESAPEAAPVAIDQMRIEEALPYAGAAGLVLLALAGTGIAVRRRRRRREDAIEDAKWQHIVAAPASAFEPDPAPAPTAMIEPAPTFVRTPAPVTPAPLPAAAAASTLPAGFDTSRFGRHVQAAYAGPTPDNPSASLKRRLTVAHFLDQKDDAAVESAPAQGAMNSSPGKTAAKPAWAGRGDGEFMLRRDDRQPTVKTTFQK